MDICCRRQIRPNKELQLRLEGIGGKTWFWIALVLWALAFYILTLFGLGSKFERSTDTASVAALPALNTKPVPDRLGALADYEVITQRSLFSENRQPLPFFLNPGSNEGEKNESNAFDYLLTSVLITPRLSMAIIRKPNGEGEPIRLKIGDSPEASSWTLASVEPRAATFNGPAGSIKLDLRVFNGENAEMPTPTAETSVPPAARPPERVSPPAQPAMAAQGARAIAPPQGPAAAPNPPDASNSNAASEDSGPSSEQIESIRRRIQERREQLRRQSGAGK